MPRKASDQAEDESAAADGSRLVVGLADLSKQELIEAVSLKAVQIAVERVVPELAGVGLDPFVDRVDLNAVAALVLHEARRRIVGRALEANGCTVEFADYCKMAWRPTR